MGRPLNTDGRDTREAIIDAALDAFADRGFHGVSMKEIAAAVGVRDSALYHYFASKEALVDAIVAERSFRDSATDQDAQRVLSETPCPDARSVLETIGDVIVARMTSPRLQKLYRFLLIDSLLNAERRENYLQKIDDQPLPQIMARLVEAGMLRGNPELLAMEFVAPFHVLTILSVFQAKHPFTRALDAFVRDHVDQFLNGASRKSK